MRVPGLIIATSALLAACGSDDTVPAAAPNGQAEPPAARRTPAVPTAAAAGEEPAPRWNLQLSGEGVALALLPKTGPAAIRLFCPAGGKRLLINVPGFRPIGSEERLSFGSGGDSVALVADSGGDRRRGGVSGAGEVPEALEAMVRGPVSASYGAQRSGPHEAPPQALARAFVAACRQGAGAKAADAATAAASPCLVQDGEILRMTPLRAVGTEPFWGARIEGRCVTYSHPDDQKGTRIWTRYAPGPDGGVWSGALGGRAFRLTTRARKDCSDGMSDRLYPFAVELVVGGERRSGCAEPLQER